MEVEIFYKLLHLTYLFFIPSRLLSRLVTFRDLCLPSIKHQTYPNITHRVFISDDLPKQAREILEELCASSPKTQIKVIRKSDLASLLRECCAGEQGKIKFIANLEDDDYLAPWYFEELIQSFTEKDKTRDTFYTCANGLQITWKDLDSRIAFQEVTLENLKTLFTAFPSIYQVFKASVRHYPLNNMGLTGPM